MTIAWMRVRLLLAAAAPLAVAACAGQPGVSANAAPAVASQANQVNPFYGVPPYLMRPDGTMINGLLPINPDDQS